MISLVVEHYDNWLSLQTTKFKFSMSEAVSAEFCLEITQIKSVTRPDVFLPIRSPDLFSTLGDVL